MARAFSALALILASLATLFYIAAMCTPWWYTKYYAANSSNHAFYDANPNLDQHTGLFSMTNCFIDGSCITGGTIYKNNSSLQWVYTTVLVLMIVGWVPWLIFLHLVWSRSSKNRVAMKGRRSLMVITALLTMALIVAAIIVFAVGMVKTNGVYNSSGLYGHLQVFGAGSFIGTGNQNFGFDGNNYEGIIAPISFGSLPFGNQSMTFLGAGIPLVYNQNFENINGTLKYKYGAHSAWYCALLTFALIPLALILGLLIKPTQRIVTQTRTTERVVSTQPAIVNGGYIPQQPTYVQGNQAV